MASKEVYLSLHWPQALWQTSWIYLPIHSDPPVRILLLHLRWSFQKRHLLLLPPTFHANLADWALSLQVGELPALAEATSMVGSSYLTLVGELPAPAEATSMMGFPFLTLTNRTVTVAPSSPLKFLITRPCPGSSIAIVSASGWQASFCRTMVTC